MVASLQAKKETLEAKLRDKTKELKKICFEEAELTGILPPETPLEPGESPPQFRRRIGTSFTYPEYLIDKLHSKEDKTIVALELDCKIQTGIAEAALGIANDGSASKSVRRRHKLIYQETQQRLCELESQLSVLKQNQAKQIKKHKSASSDHNVITVESDDKDVNNATLRHAVLSHSLSDQSVSSARHFHTIHSLPKHDVMSVPYSYRIQPCYHTYSGDNFASNGKSYTMANSPQLYSNSSCSTPVDPGWKTGSERDSFSNNALNNNTPSHLHFEPEVNLFQNRQSIVGRNSPWMMSSLNKGDGRNSSTLPRNSCVPVSNSVLLPGQTYPDNSLMRTQSLGNVGTYQIAAEKKKEKEWYETSLDSAPMSPRSPKVDASLEAHTPDLQPAENVPISVTHHAIVSNIQYDTVVPYESPKNHTVIEAGKWQPYREVTKPFEMSDFYKYSTKYRKGRASPHSSDKQSHQHKVLYKPLQPQECQPLSNKISCSESNDQGLVTAGDDQIVSPTMPDNFSWLCGKLPNTTAATIV